VGFTNVSVERFSSFSMANASMRHAFGKAAVKLGTQSMHGMVTRGGFDWVQSHEGVDDVVRQLNEEIDSGEHLVGMTMDWIVAQEPEQ
jgi:hypothetical protein